MKQRSSDATVLPWMPELIGLWGFAVAQPIYALLAGHPAFITAHGMNYPIAVGLAAGLSVLCPVLIWLVLISLKFWQRAVSQHAFRLVVTGLVLAFAAPVSWRLDVQTVWQVLCWFALSATLLWLYFGTRVGYLFMRVLAAGGLLFPLFFLFSQPVASALAAQLDKVPFAGDRAPNVVILVFDELPTHALTVGGEQVNGRLLPNFARLADRSSWYRNASAVSTHTEYAIPALVTGMRPTPGRSVGGPDAATFPQSVFALLADRYELVASEPVTGLCPAPDCERTNASTQSVATLMVDLLVAYLHVVTPPALRDELPDIKQQWSGFRFGRLADRAVPALGLTRHVQVQRMLQSIRERPKPTLYFLHVTLPHAPYHYAPSGRLVFRHEPLRAITTEKGDEVLSTDPVAITELRQLFLWQLRYADKIVGDVIRKLETIGEMDPALLIVTADHGVSVSPGSKRRRLDAHNAADMLGVPLFVKLPGQRAGAIVDRNVEIVDILPTVMEVVGMAIPWQISGESLNRAAHPAKLLEDDSELYEFPANAALASDAARRRWAWMRTMGHDQALEDWSFRPDMPISPTHTVELNESQLFGNVAPDYFLPLIVRGTLIGPVSDSIELAVAVNGRVRVRAMRYAQEGAQKFVAFLPPSSLRQGSNRIDVLSRLPGRVPVRLVDGSHSAALDLHQDVD